MNASGSHRTVLNTKFLTASVLFTMATINYCVSYWLLILLDAEDGVNVAPTSDIRDSPRSYNRFKEIKYISLRSLSFTLYFITILSYVPTLKKLTDRRTNR
jgi:hypothetical protein